MKRFALVLAVAVTALVFAGCSSDKSSSASPPSTSGSGGSSSTVSKGSGSSSGSAIPQSAAIDGVTKDLTKPGAANLVAKCNVLATVVLGKDVGLDNDPVVKDALDGLVTVVRPMDPAVAEALAADAKSAAEWCKTMGMTNI